MNLTSLFITGLLIENVILTRFLGICPFIGTSASKKSAIGMLFSVIFVMLTSSIITYFIYYYLLVPYEKEFLKTIVFILVIASLVQITEIIIKKVSPKLEELLGIYLPLVTTNCAILGVVLINVNNEYSIIETIIYALGSALGFSLVIYIFSTIRERLETSPMPKSVRGLPIALITAAIMSLIFARYVGM